VLKGETHTRGLRLGRSVVDQYCAILNIADHILHSYSVTHSLSMHWSPRPRVTER